MITWAISSYPAFTFSTSTNYIVLNSHCIFPIYYPHFIYKGKKCLKGKPIMDLQRNEETDMKEKYVERQRDEGEKGA